MELTGKCKNDFERWYNEYNEFRFSSSQFGAILGTFHNLPKLSDSMQYGIYVDFLDEKGYEIDECKHGFVIRRDGENKSISYMKCKNRKESRKEAIKAMNKIYNNE